MNTEHSDLTQICHENRYLNSIITGHCYLNMVRNLFSSLLTVFSYSLNSSEQQLVEVGHVQQVKTEEVSVEDSPQY